MRCTRIAGARAGLALLVIAGATAGTFAQTAPASGKIPITTSSEEARALYLKGRDLAEKLRATDARRFYEQAVAKDKNFALGLRRPGEHVGHDQRVHRRGDEGGGLVVEGQRRRAPHHPWRSSRD